MYERILVPLDGSKVGEAALPYVEELVSKLLPAVKVEVTLLDTREESQPSENTLVLVLKETEVAIPMESMVNLEAERKRLEKEIGQSQAELAQLEARLNNKEFLTKAPAAVVDKERQKLYTLTDKLERLRQQILKY